MKDLQITRRQIVKGAAAAGVLGALGLPAAALADEDERGRRVRWDLVLVGSGCATEGGPASAHAADGSRITIRGSGTFPNVRNRCVRGVTGGGTYTVVATNPNCFPGSGTFKVTELLSWDPAPGTLPIADCIGKKEKATAGLVKLRVHYSNEKHGVLTVSCHLAGSPDCMFEGITASMDHEDFSVSEAPTTPFTDANRTLFHYLDGGED